MDPSHGGPCQGIRNSIPALAALGVSNEVVSLDSVESQFLGGDPFPIHALGSSRGSWAYNSDLLPWLIEHLLNYDAVIVHGLWLYHSFAVTKALRTLRRSARSTSRASTSIRLPRCYVMPHGMLDPYFQRDPSRRLKAARNWVYWHLIERTVINGADGILFTCEEEMRLARQTFNGYHPRQELNVGYGVAEPPVFTPAMRSAFTAACPALGNQPYLLFLSRIHPKKGVDLLIRAYSDLAQKHLRGADTTAPLPVLVIAGPLDSPYAREMQELAEKLLPPSSATTSGRPAIHFPGMLAGDAKWGAFHGCEAFILPSHQENFGIAVVEALACGKPVLISKQVNIWREIVAAGGGIAEDDHLEGTAKLFEQWQSKVIATDQVTPIKARKCFEDHYSIEGAATRLNAALSAQKI
jgi:glycosyltransferase involved in cell wall biosynthesis